MLVLVRCIQSLSSCLLLIALIPLQLRVAILNLFWYGVDVAVAGVGSIGIMGVVWSCSSCAVRSGACLAGAGTSDLLVLACLRPCCFLVFRCRARRARAVSLRWPLCVAGREILVVEFSLRALPLRPTGAGAVAADPASLVEALRGSRVVGLLEVPLSGWG